MTAAKPPAWRLELVASTAREWVDVPAEVRLRRALKLLGSGSRRDKAKRMLDDPKRFR